MAEAQRFSHIKVSDAEDDIVIQAGAVPPCEPAPTAAEPEPEPAPVAEPAPSSAPAPAEEPAPRPKHADAYRETTLEDLESTKMGTAQKAVIVLAVLGVIAFVVWYCLLR